MNVDKLADQVADKVVEKVRPYGQLPKPPHGSECNQCGQCCMTSRCVLGNRLYGPWYPGAPACPALEKAGGSRWWCGAVSDPLHYVESDHKKKKLQRAARLLVTIGMGCDATANDEDPDPEFSEKYAAALQEMGGKLAEARRIWEM